MRHVVTPGRENVAYVSPFYGSYCYTFKNPTKDRVYVKVLKFIDEHPKCKRTDIQNAIWGSARRGLHSTTFAHMLYHDLIDYDKQFRYVIRRKGKNILKKVNK